MELIIRRGFLRQLKFSLKKEKEKILGTHEFYICMYIFLYFGLLNVRKCTVNFCPN